MIIMKHPPGLMKECTTGFSWTMFFFGVFVPLIRGDWKWFGLILAATIVAGCIHPSCAGIVPFGMSFVYNKLYIKDLIEKGWEPADEQSGLWLKANGIISKPETDSVAEEQTETVNIQK